MSDLRQVRELEMEEAVSENSFVNYLRRQGGLSEQQIEHEEATYAALNVLHREGFDARVVQYLTGSDPNAMTCRIEIAMVKR